MHRSCLNRIQEGGFMMASSYHIGFTTLKNEVRIEHLPISGKMPPWLSGTLIRNGPAKFEVVTQSFRYWFDGLSMLHCFTCKDGVISYANKYLQSRDYRESMAQGRIAMRTFATDPCRSLFQRIFSLFFPNISDNANVNVMRIADHSIAMTETLLPIKFDPYTLKTIGIFDRDRDRMAGSLALTYHKRPDHNSTQPD